MRIVPPLALGRFPTPVFRAQAVECSRAELWIKNDGVTAELYGGNKVRKLEHILAEAQARGARRIVTMGAGGSHHVLATTLYARSLGISTAAVLFPQPWSEHAERTLRAGLGAGLEPVVVGSRSAIPFGVARLLSRGDYLVPAGGSSRLGTLGYLAAVGELLGQIRAGELPEPDVIVAPLGSGGTVAGILAGVVREGLKARVVGVDVAIGSAIGLPLVLGLARAATRADAGSAGLLRLARGVTIERGYLGAGYGCSTSAGERATALARGTGLELDATYTAKTFAAALDLTQSLPGRIVLYWHTLSARSLQPLLEAAPAELPRALERLLPRSADCGKRTSFE